MASTHVFGNRAVEGILIHEKSLFLFRKIPNGSLNSLANLEHELFSFTSLERLFISALTCLVHRQLWSECLYSQLSLKDLINQRSETTVSVIYILRSPDASFVSKRTRWNGMLFN